MSARSPFGAFFLGAAHKHNGDDLSADRLGGDDFECACSEIEGLHYEWDHKKVPPPPPKAPTARRNRRGDGDV